MTEQGADVVETLKTFDPVANWNDPEQEALRILANVVNQFEAGVIAPIELICRAG